jgi:hypothetical protein
MLNLTQGGDHGSVALVVGFPAAVSACLCRQERLDAGVGQGAISRYIEAARSAGQIVENLPGIRSQKGPDEP